ncbi:MAG TPA: hypothetical protein VK879_16440 [Candidatus Sulfomarinibacteraceae bacterium]|nr:hypothetical protein [Candidatus Sulfomarinibacteraceae bacterium]
MSEPIIYFDRSRIRDGKFEALKKAMNELIEFVDANEPQIIAYNVYFSEDRTQMTVLQIHSDSASLATHMEVAGDMFPRFSEFIRMEAIEIYGEPDEELVEQLKGKAKMLGSGTVKVHDPHGGLDRFSH